MLYPQTTSSILKSTNGSYEVKRFTAFLSTGLAVCLILIGAISPVVAHASAVFSHGEGTEEDPFKVSNCDQLQAIQNDLDAYYKLVVNIDCGSNSFVHIGDDDTPFTGSLDGNNKIIKDLDIDDFGLFGRIDKGQVRDLKLINPSVSGTTYVGSLAGTVNGEGANISNVHVVGGSVSATSNYIGGLIGSAAAFYLEDLNNPVIEKSSFRGSVSSPGVMGGFIGTANGSAYIHNNYAITTLTILPEDSATVGGFFGTNSSYQTAENYAITTIDADEAGFNSTVGGFVGVANGGQTQSFADMNYNSGATNIGDFMGISAGSTIGSDRYGDHGHGFSSNSANPGAGGAQAVDTQSNPGYFYDKNNVPLSMWNFENIWQEVEGDYPRIQGESGFSEASDDINGDDINDSYQATVIGVPDGEENLTVVELNSDTDCTLDPTGSWVDSGYYKADPYYPLQIPKMTAFTVYCPSPGAQVQVTLVYPEEYDVSKSVIRFYDDVADEYHTVNGVEFGTREINGNTVTTATYLLVDGGENDTDGVANSVIHDPVGIAVNNAPAGVVSSTSSSSSNGTLAETGQSAPLLALFATIIIIFSMTTIAMQRRYAAKI